MSTDKCQHVHDHIAAQQLINRYCEAVTLRKWDQLADCYEKDAHWCSKPPVEFAFQGREAIRANAIDITCRLDFLVMMPQSIVVDLSGETGRISTVLHEYASLEGEAVMMFGHYDDEVVRDGRGWVFSRRVFSPIHFTMPDGIEAKLVGGR